VVEWLIGVHRRKGTLLFSVPLGVVSRTNPLVAPTGTVAVIRSQQMG
jgi:hypothetical protein